MDVISIHKDDWGPGAWKFLHSVALKYPSNPSDDDKNNYFIFYDNLQNILPCPKCKENYKDHLQKFPLKESLENNVSLFKWTVDIHNEVNNLNNKKIYSYEEAFQLYNNPPTNNHDIMIIIGFILFIIFIILYFKK